MKKKKQKKRNPIAQAVRQIVPKIIQNKKQKMIEEDRMRLSGHNED